MSLLYGGCTHFLGCVPSLPRVSPHFLRCPHFLGCALTSWGVPSLPGVCPHFLGCALTSWGVPSLPGVCPHFLGCALTSWGVPSLSWGSSLSTILYSPQLSLDLSSCPVTARSWCMWQNERNRRLVPSSRK